MIKKWIFPLFLVGVLTGCSNVTGKNEFYDIVGTIEQSLEQKPDWDRLKLLADDLVTTHANNEWKLQLMGDEDEYESIKETIDHLVVAIEEKDITETKLELSSIKSHLEDIYSL